MMECRCQPCSELTPRMTNPTSPEVLCDALLATHGELLGGAALARALGFKTQRAFQKARLAGRLPIDTFAITGRRGHFARTRDVAAWLSSLGKAVAPRQHRISISKGPYGQED